LLLQKRGGDDIQPPFVGDLLEIVDPRRAGSVTATIVGPNAAGAAASVFTVPRSGLYLVEASIFALAGVVLTWRLLYTPVGGTAIFEHRVVATSQGFKLGPWLLLLDVGDTIQWTNVDAQGVGDSEVVSITNFEIALS